MGRPGIQSRFLLLRQHVDGLVHAEATTVGFRGWILAGSLDHGNELGHTQKALPGHPSRFRARGRCVLFQQAKVKVPGHRQMVPNSPDRAPDCSAILAGYLMLGKKLLPASQTVCQSNVRGAVQDCLADASLTAGEVVSAASAMTGS